MDIPRLFHSYHFDLIDIYSSICRIIQLWVEDGAQFTFYQEHNRSLGVSAVDCIFFLEELCAFEGALWVMTVCTMVKTLWPQIFDKHNQKCSQPNLLQYDKVQRLRPDALWYITGMLWNNYSRGNISNPDPFWNLEPPTHAVF